MSDEKEWYFYIIKNQNCTYAGVSPDPVQRLRKHNGEIKVVQNTPYLKDLDGNMYV